MSKFDYKNWDDIREDRRRQKKIKKKVKNKSGAWAKPRKAYNWLTGARK